MTPEDAQRLLDGITMPAPWRQSDSSYRGCGQVLDHGGVSIVSINDIDPVIPIPDSHLIAAAPDMAHTIASLEYVYWVRYETTGATSRTGSWETIDTELIPRDEAINFARNNNVDDIGTRHARVMRRLAGPEEEVI